MGFTAALEAVQNGKSDIAMAGITVNEERKANMDFSDSYATGIQVVIIKEDSPAVQSLDDLASGVLIGTQEGTTGYIYCSDTVENGGYGEEHVMAYETGAVAIQALLAGKVDCVVIDNQPAQEYVKANPGLEILDTEFAVEDYAIAVKKGNSQLLDEVNKALSELIADGSVQKVVDRYITAG
jgi:polar amino acid transport system substrate-binding protein